MRIGRRWRAAVVAAALLLTVTAGPTAAFTYNYSSYARDNSQVDIFGNGQYHGVYAEFFATSTVQSGTNCGLPLNASANPVIQEVRVGRSSTNWLWLRYIDQCSGYGWWSYGYSDTNGEHVVETGLGFSPGWHTFAIYRNASANSSTWYFSIDNVNQNYMISSGSNYSWVEAGLYSHAPSATVIPGSEFTNLQWHDWTGAWHSWAGEDYAYASLELCGRWGDPTTWWEGSIGKC